MANRKRGTFSLPEELKTDEKLSTKKELGLRKYVPLCPPVPNKIRKSILASNNPLEKPEPVCFNLSVNLSPVYNPKLNTSYLDQVFNKQGLVGEGSFGRVYRVRSREDNKVYAVKRLKSAISFKDRYAEVRNNEKVGVHPNCVQFFMAWKEGVEVYMLLEFCDMSLADYSILNSDIPEDLLWNVLYDMCKALNFLHNRDLLHLDVKPANIMMKDGYYKLADFGILVDLKLSPMICKSTLSDGDSKYLALEVLEGVYQPSCDIFGLGISLLELAADLELPNHGPLWQQLRHDVLPQNFYDRVSLGFQVIIERMLNPEYVSRPSAEKILKYNSIKMIEKNDKRNSRVNYAAPYINSESDCISLNIPVMVNNNNNIIETPHCKSNENVKEIGNCSDGSASQLPNQKLLFHVPENDHSPEGRKHSLTFAEMNELFETSFASKSNCTIDTDNSMLALELNASSLTEDMFLMDTDTGIKQDSQNDNGMISLENGNMITSTPILRCKLSRKMPKTKLTFD